MAYDNEMRGVLFRNKKRDNDRAPQATGRIQINGVVYWLSAWTATKDGDKYQQLRAERAQDKYQPTEVRGAAPAPAAETPAPTAEDFGMTPGTDPEDIPF